MFDPQSRYYKQSIMYRQDARGRKVPVVVDSRRPVQGVRGYHLLNEGQRLDYLANAYLNNPAGFWQICELNDVLYPEALAEHPEIAIPNP